MSLTSLAQQLRKHQTAQSSSFKTSSKTSISFLYDSKQSASIDRETHHLIAVSGLNELAKIDSTCLTFLQTLFSDSSKSFDRTRLTKAEHNDLNQEIERFLLQVLSPYFLNTASHKTLEWLVYRYKVHEFNTNALIFSILPYHETRHFTRVIQMCPLGASNDEQINNIEFQWLKPLKKTGAILVKSVLHENLLNNLDRLRLLADRLIENSKLGYNVSLWSSFMTSTFICLIEKRPQQNENLVSLIIQFVSRSLSSATMNESCCRTLSIASYVILGYMCTKVQFKEARLTSVLKKLATNYDQQVSSNKPDNEFLLCLYAICRHQHQQELPSSLASLLIREKHLLLARQQSDSPHAQHLLCYLIKSLLPTIDQQSNFDILLHLLRQVDHQNFMAIREAIQTISKHQDNEKLLPFHAKLIRIIERQFPNTFDRVIKCMDKDEFSRVFESDLYIRVDGNSLNVITALNHHQSSVRMAAIEKVAQPDSFDSLESNVRESIRSSVRQIFVEQQDRKLLTKLFRIQNLDVLLNKEDLLFYGAKLLTKCSQQIAANQDEMKVKASWTQIRDRLLALLFSLDQHFNQKEFVQLFSRYLFPSDQQQLEILPKLIESNCFKALDVADLPTREEMEGSQGIVKLFQHYAQHAVDHNLELIDILIDSNGNNRNYNLVCAMSLLQLVLQNFVLDHNLTEQCIRKLIQVLQKLLLDCCFTRVGKSKKADAFQHQLNKIEENQLVAEFVQLCMQTVIESIASPNDDEPLAVYFERNDCCLTLTFNLLCDLSQRHSLSCAGNLLRKFIKKCDNLFNHQYFCCMWVNESDLQMQARSLCISSQLLQDYKLTQLQTLHLLVALSSPSQSIRQLAANLLNQIDPESNPLVQYLLQECGASETVLRASAVLKVLPDFLASQSSSSSSSSSDSLNELCLNTIKVDSDTGEHMKAGLLKLLRHHYDQTFYEHLLSLVSHLLHKEATSITTSEQLLLVSIFDCLISFFSQQDVLDKFKDKKVAGENGYIRLAKTFCQLIRSSRCRQYTLQRLKPRWFRTQLKSNSLAILILDTLLHDFIQNNQNDLVKEKILSLVGDGLLISKLIQKLTIQTTVTSRKEFGSEKRIRLEKRIQYNSESVEWKKSILLLEAIQSKQEISNSSVFLKHLFRLLRDTFEFDPGQSTSTEYLLQLLLFNIHNCIDQDDCDIQHFDIQVIFECLKFARLRATQRELLIILNRVTCHFRKEILDNFMVIFTYIGTNMIQCSDEHSLKVVDSTMDTILPPLFEKNEKVKLQVLDTFIDALAEIPATRRVRVFDKLIHLMDEPNSLWTVLLRLDRRAVSDSMLQQQICSFTQQLADRFPIEIQLVTLVNILIHLCRAQENGIFFGTSDHQLDLHILLLDQLHSCLTSTAFIANVAEADWTDVNIHFTNILNKLLQLVSSLNNTNGGSNTNSTYKQVNDKLYSILDKYSQLLPVDEFTGVLYSLLESSAGEICRRSLRILVEKLNVLPQPIDEEVWNRFLKPLQDIIAKVRKEEKKEKEEEEEGDDENNVLLTNGQLALVGIKLIVQKTQRIEEKQLEKSIKLILNVVNTIKVDGGKSINFISAAILCLVRLISGLNTTAIQHLAPVLKFTLKQLESSCPTDTLVISSLSALCKYTNQFSGYLGKFLVPILKHSCLLRLRMSAKTVSTEVINTKLATIEKNLSTLVPVRKMVEAFDQTYDLLLKESLDSLEYLFIVIQSCLTQTSNDTVEAELLLLNPLLFKLLSFRHTQHDLPATCVVDKLDHIEHCCIRILCHLLPKLSESKFKRFVVQLNEWPKEEMLPMETDDDGGDGDNIDQFNFVKLVTFYRLQNALAQTLRELYTIIVLPIITPNCIQLLNLKNVKHIPVDTLHAVMFNMLQSLAMSFQFNDKSVAWFGDLVEKLICPVVDQIGQNFGQQTQYEQRIQEGVGRCVSNFVRNFNDYSLIKQIHGQILSHCRHRSLQVKLASLHVLHQFIMACAEEYVTYLPDAVPFLVELYEDDSDHIQKELIVLFRDIEQIIGEPISNYM